MPLPCLYTVIAGHENDPADTDTDTDADVADADDAAEGLLVCCLQFA